MLRTVRAIVRKGKIEMVEPLDLPEGATVLVTLLSDEETKFWSDVSQRSLDAVWNNAGDDVYAELFKK